MAGLRCRPLARARVLGCHWYPRLADSPWATCFRPLARARVLGCHWYPRLADSPWATCFRPLARLASLPRARARLL